MNDTLRQRSPIELNAIKASMVNASKLTLAMMITIPLGIVTRILLPRWLGADAAGKLYFSESFPVFVISFMQLGIPAYIQKTVSNNAHHAGEIFRPIFLFLLTLGVLLTLSIWSILKLNHYTSDIIVLTVIMASYQTLVTTHDVLQKIYISLDRVTAVALLNILAKTLVVIFVIAAVFTSHDLRLIALSFWLAQAITLGFLLAHAGAQGFWQKDAHLSILKPIFTMSLPFFLLSVVAQISGSVDATILSKLANFKEVGLYSASQRLLGLLLVFATIVQSCLTPILSRTYAASVVDYNRINCLIFRTVLIGTFPFCLVLILFGREITHLIYGADFIRAGHALSLSGLGLFFSTLVLLLGQHLVVTTNGRRMSLALLLTMAPRIAVMFFVVPYCGRLWGEGGAAAGAVLSITLAELCTATAFFRISPKDVHLRPMVHTLGLLFLPLLLLSLTQSLWATFPLYARISLGIIVFPGYLSVTGTFTLNHLREGLSLLKKAYHPLTYAEPI